MSLKDRLKKVIRKIEGYGSMAVAAVAPVLGAAILGPAGAAAGTALGAGATRYGVAQLARSKGTKGMEARTAGREFAGYAAMYGGAVTGIAGGLALAGGTGIATSSLTAIGNIFGPSTPTGVQNGSPGWGKGELLDTLYNSGSNVTGTSYEALGAGMPGSRVPTPPASGPGTGAGALDNVIKMLFGTPTVNATGAPKDGKDPGTGAKSVLGALLSPEILLIGGAVLLVVLLAGKGGGGK